MGLGFVVWGSRGQRTRGHTAGCAVPAAPTSLMAPDHLLHTCSALTARCLPFIPSSGLQGWAPRGAEGLQAWQETWEQHFCPGSGLLWVPLHPWLLWILLWPPCSRPAHLHPGCDPVCWGGCLLPGSFAQEVQLDSSWGWQCPSPRPGAQRPEGRGAASRGLLRPPVPSGPAQRPL